MVGRFSTPRPFGSPSTSLSSSPLRLRIHFGGSERSRRPNFITGLDKQTFTRVALVVLYLRDSRLRQHPPGSNASDLCTFQRWSDGGAFNQLAHYSWFAPMDAGRCRRRLDRRIVRGFSCWFLPSSFSHVPRGQRGSRSLTRGRRTLFQGARVLSLLLTGFAVALLAGVLTAYSAVHTSKVTPISSPHSEEEQADRLANTAITVSAMAVLGALAIPTILRNL